MTSDGWKLIRLQVAVPEKTYEELYNLSIDPAEIANLVEQHPEVATRLRNMIVGQRTELIEYLFLQQVFQESIQLLIQPFQQLFVYQQGIVVQQ